MHALIMGVVIALLPYIYYVSVGMIQNLAIDYTYHVDLYTALWTHFQPFLVGVLLGYALHHLRTKEVKIDFLLNILLWKAAFAVVYGTYDAGLLEKCIYSQPACTTLFRGLRGNFLWLGLSSSM
jgi:hypothetical protein